MARISTAVALSAILLASTVYIFFYYEPKLKTPKDLHQVYDYVIVGAGSAGSVLAARLSEDEEVSVLLMEAGGTEPWWTRIPGLVPFSQLSSIDWQFSTVPQQLALWGLNNRTGHWPRGKVMGGTSVINYMAHTRGNRKDYDRWERKFGAKGWSWNDVLPYFKKLERANIDSSSDTRGTSGPYSCDYAEQTPLGRAFIDGGQELGFKANRDYNGETQSGFARTQLSRENGRRVSAASAFLRPAMGRPNLHVLANAQATKVRFNDDREASGVEYSFDNEEKFVRARKEVILSAGAVKSPQLLMLSGVGPREHLEQFGIPVIADSPNVGQNLKDHLLGGVYYTVNDSSAIANTKRLVGLTTLPTEIYGFFANGKGLLTEPGMEAYGFLNSGFQEEGYDNDLQLIFIPLDPLLDKQFTHLMNYNESTVDAMVSGRESVENLFLLAASINHVRSVGAIRLQSSNPLTKPLIDPHYLENDRDVKALAKGQQILHKIATETAAMRRFDVKSPASNDPNCIDHKLWSNAYFECLVRSVFVTNYHPMCTCRMGASIDRAVVDHQLRWMLVNIYCNTVNPR